MPVRDRVVLLAAGAIACISTAALAQEYPAKPIYFITAEAGGGGDILARTLAQGISGPLGQPVVVENRPSRLGGELAAKAAPDGYTVVTAASTFILAPLLEKTGYDPVRDFAPITLATRTPNLMVVHSSLPVKSVKEFVALAKSRPGELNYGSGGAGSSAHTGAELLNSMAGIKTVRINYKGTGPAVNDLVKGDVQWMIAVASSVVPHVKSGRLKALAVTTAEPSRLFPDVPTVAQTLPGYEMSSMTGVLAPAKTPAAIVSRLNQEMVRVLKRPDAQEKFFNLGAEAVGSTPEELAARIKSDIAKIGKIIRDAGIKVE